MQYERFGRIASRFVRWVRFLHSISLELVVSGCAYWYDQTYSTQSFFELTSIGETEVLPDANDQLSRQCVDNVGVESLTTPGISS